jgi:hypothetical protein
MGVLRKVSQWVNKVSRWDTFSKKGISRSSSATLSNPPVPTSAYRARSNSVPADDLVGEIDVERLRRRLGLTRTQFVNL